MGVAEIIFIIPIVAIVGGLVFAAYSEYLKYRKEMIKMKNSTDKNSETIKAEYQDFVLGVDARIQKLEERIKMLESKSRYENNSGNAEQKNRL